MVVESRVIVDKKGESISDFVLNVGKR